MSRNGVRNWPPVCDIVKLLQDRCNCQIVDIGSLNVRFTLCHFFETYLRHLFYGLS